MIDESFDSKFTKTEPKPYEFRSKPAWQRLIIMSAGVVMNFITAIVVFAMLLFSTGEEYIALQDAKYGMEFSSIAHKQGFKDGDILLQADGINLESLSEETMRLVLNAKEVKVLRGTDTVNVSISENFMEELIASKEGFANFRTPFVVKVYRSPSLQMRNVHLVKVTVYASNNLRHIMKRWCRINPF